MKKLNEKRKIENPGNMVKKCLIPGCNPNYRNRKGCCATEQKTPVFRLPRDEAQYSQWMNAMPYTNITTRFGDLRKTLARIVPYSLYKRKNKTKGSTICLARRASKLLTKTYSCSTKYKKSSMEVGKSSPDELDSSKEMNRVSYNDIVDRVVIKKKKNTILGVQLLHFVMIIL